MVGRIVVKACRSALRERSRRFIREIPVSDFGAADESLIVAGRNHEDRAVNLDRIERALSRIRPEERVVLWLHHYEDLSLAEITAPDGTDLVVCEATPEISADVLQLEYREGPCGGEVDEIRWAVGADGLHLTLVETNAPFEANQAYLEAKPWQRVGDEQQASASEY